MTQSGNIAHLTLLGQLAQMDVTKLRVGCGCTGSTEGEVGAYSDLFKSPRFCKRFAEYDWPKWLGEQPASEQDWEQFKFQTLPPRYLGPMLPAELKTRSCPQHYYAAPPASSATTIVRFFKEVTIILQNAIPRTNNKFVRRALPSAPPTRHTAEENLPASKSSVRGLLHACQVKYGY
jgi:hypothetical protein